MPTLASRDDTGHGRGLGEALLRDQKLERAIAPATGRNLEHACLAALGVENGSDIEALQERTPGDVFRQLLDRDARLHAPDIRLGEDELVEGDVARGRQGDLLNGRCHRDVSATGAEKLSLGFKPVT